MDNITHSLFAVALARSGLERRGPWVTPVLVIAANLPDLDILIPPFTTANYLVVHRGISHSVIGLLAQSGILALCVWLYTKITGRETPQPRELVGVSLLGFFSHTAMDWLNSYGVRPWLPWDATTYFGDMVFIIDPWLWLWLLMVLVYTRVQTRGSMLVAAVLFSVMGAVLLAGARSALVPWQVPALWFALALGLLAFRARRDFIPAPRWAWCGLMLVGLQLGLLFAGARTAPGLAAQVKSVSGPYERLSVTPRPGVPFQFSVLRQDARVVERIDIDMFQRSATISGSMLTRRDDPLLLQVERTTEFRAWVLFARHPYMEREGDTLVLGDARFRMFGRGDWSALRVKLSDSPSKTP